MMSRLGQRPPGCCLPVPRDHSAATRLELPRVLQRSRGRATGCSSHDGLELGRPNELHVWRREAIPALTDEQPLEEIDASGTSTCRVDLALTMADPASLYGDRGADGSHVTPDDLNLIAAGA